MMTRMRFLGLTVLAPLVRFFGQDTPQSESSEIPTILIPEAVRSRIAEIIRKEDVKITGLSWFVPPGPDGQIRSGQMYFVCDEERDWRVK